MLITMQSGADYSAISTLLLCNQHPITTPLSPLGSLHRPFAPNRSLGRRQLSVPSYSGFSDILRSSMHHLAPCFISTKPTTPSMNHDTNWQIVTQEEQVYNDRFGIKHNIAWQNNVVRQCYVYGMAGIFPLLEAYEIRSNMPCRVAKSCIWLKCCCCH